MAVVDRNTSINRFKDGLTPPEEHFEDWLDSFIHKWDFVTEFTTTGNTSTAISLASGLILEKVLVVAPSSATYSIGTSAGGTNVLDSEAVSANVGRVSVINFFANGTTLLHFTGLPAGTLLKLFKQ